MPETSQNEVTYEKTPKYMVIPEVPGIYPKLYLLYPGSNKIAKPFSL